MRDPLRDADRWFRESEIDLSVAGELTERFPARACFHAQQAAEKALKAILYAAGQRAVLGHSLWDLGEDVARNVDGYADIRGEIAKLDRYYIPTRYPNGLPEGGLPSESFDADDARSAIGIAAKAIEVARTFIGTKG